MIIETINARILTTALLYVFPVLAVDAAQHTAPKTSTATTTRSVSQLRTCQKRSAALSCPRVSRTPVFLPPPVYDMNRGDCALLGRKAEIEAYLAALEETAARCHARQESIWHALQDVKDRFDRQIDALPQAEHAGGAMRSSFLSAMPAEPDDMAGSAPQFYSVWLRRIRESTANYCHMVDELPKTMANSCATINRNISSNGGCATDMQKMAYQHWIDHDLESTRLDRYDAANLYYTNKLQRYGWGNFRRYFSEENILCEDSKEGS